MTEGQYSPVRLELARLVSSLLYGTQSMLVLNLLAFENKKYIADGPFGEILTKTELIRMLGFTLPYNKRRFFIFVFKPKRRELNAARGPNWIAPHRLNSSRKGLGTSL